EALRDELRQWRIELTSRRPESSGPEGLHTVHDDSKVQPCNGVTGPSLPRQAWIECDCRSPRSHEAVA
ncbi:MAG: hypothetical protein KGR99_17880, partial [Betaproteobacteria bacterium]|nr:hypothetical protein [Betaproteobacteria bacterium]MDE2154219.1 hypothetical protein [Betaproteobacteria bacterium]